MMSRTIAFLALAFVSTNGLLVKPKPEFGATGASLKVSTRAGSNQLQSASNDVWGALEHQINFLQRQVSEGQKKDKDDLTRLAMLQNLKPCAQCQAPKRFGAVYDGGYAMCSELMQKDMVKAGYSIGISGYDNWGSDVSLKLGVPIYQFDCTDSHRPPCEPQWKSPAEGCQFEFNDLCITSKKNRPADRATYKTIKELMAMHGHGNRGNTSDLLLQLDVEGYEWELFADPSTAKHLTEFSQISVEFHNLLNTTGANPGLFAHVPLQTKLKALTNLNRQFVVTHLHGNNKEGTQTLQDPNDPSQTYSIPGVLEVLYVRRGMANEQECMTDPDYAMWHDAPNQWDLPEIAPGHLPAGKSV